MNLQKYQNNGLELIIDTETGESFASQNAYARMAKKAKSTISDRVNKLEGVRSDFFKEAMVKTESGVQGVRLLTEDCIIAWLPKDNPELATQLLKLGVRVFMHKMAGYEVKSTAVQPPVITTPPQPQLPSYELARRTAETVNFVNDTLTETNPKLAQLLIDHAISDVYRAQYSAERQGLLPVTRTEPELKTVSELVEEMKWNVKQNMASALGREVAKHIGHLAKKEKRSVNERSTFLNVYPDTEQVRDTIEDILVTQAKRFLVNM